MSHRRPLVKPPASDEWRVLAKPGSALAATRSWCTLRVKHYYKEFLHVGEQQEKLRQSNRRPNMIS